MSSEETENITDFISINDIYLLDFKFERASNFETREFDIKAHKTQTRREIKAIMQKITTETEEDIDLFCVDILHGIRAIQHKTEDSQTVEEPQFILEANFRAEYRIHKNDLEDDFLAEFAQKTSTFHVYPFWRQFLFETMPKLRLPIPEVPMQKK